MLENFNVNLEVNQNNQGDIDVNGYSRRVLINNNSIGKCFLLFLGLTFYEMAALPRVILDVNKIEFNPRKIERIIKELMRCNICLQIYHDPVNIKNCLHKFCKKCIEDYNRRM